MFTYFVILHIHVVNDKYALMIAYNDTQQI